MKSTIRLSILAVAAMSCGIIASAQTVSVENQSYKTYGFSDPNPVPQTQSIYPYFRYDGFQKEGTLQEWKVVVLENDYIRVKIFPEIGGKIWSIYDKTREKEMYYDNDVVKFRDISLRGPWTSGGIEFNFGVIGHAPSCAHPVDYKVETKDDGSVSCYIGVLEMLSRSRWMIEVNLPKDAVSVRTRCFWHNGSGNFQPYYNWFNSGVKVSDDMKIIYPAKYTIGHAGNIEAYPVDEKGRDNSVYANQAYGADKSYHAGGSHKSFFGAHWPSEDFGTLHYALRDEKLGRKYFSWAQSAQGSIWIDLLTDTRPQYIEMQSGRLFNQNVPESISTPYKQTIFNPYGTDEWNEYWMPFSGLSRIDEVTPDAAVEMGDGVVTFYVFRKLRGEMKFYSKSGAEMSVVPVDWNPAKTFSTKADTSELGKIILNGNCLWSAESSEINRPNAINPRFDRNSAEGRTIWAKYYIGTRKYNDAKVEIDSALAINPASVEALNIKALLELRRMSYGESYQTTSKVLAIDQYEPYANYIGGLAALYMGDLTNAKDHFEIAAITSELRSAACTALSKIYFADGNTVLARDYALKSLVGNAYNLTAYELLYQIDPSEKLLSKINALDPLCHFCEFENMLSGKITADQLAESINEEMRWQDYMEFAVMYNSLGLKDKAYRTLDACPDSNVLIELWKAYLSNNASMIPFAEKEYLDFVFPFRPESARVLEWSVANGGSWVSTYLLAILNQHLGNRNTAREMIAGIECNYAPLYSYRSTLNGSVQDMQKACDLDKEQWRYFQDLGMYYYNRGEYVKSLAVVEPYFKKHPENIHIGDTYVKNLIALGKYAKAEKLMDNMTILPFEGQSATRIMYRDIKLHLAAENIDSRNYKQAMLKIDQARLWPEHLGVGKPYDDRIDTRLEDILTAVVLKRQGNAEGSDTMINKVLASDPDFNVTAFMTAAKICDLLGNQNSTLDKKLF